MTTDKIPTSEGEKTIPEIIDWLTYCSYRANRGYGMSHERLQRLSSCFTDAMKVKYERELTTDKNTKTGEIVK